MAAPAAPAAGGSYTVQAGDTLAEIAARLGTAGGWQALHTLNLDRIGDPNLIFIGQVLRV